MILIEKDMKSLARMEVIPPLRHGGTKRSEDRKSKNLTTDGKAVSNQRKTKTLTTEGTEEHRGRMIDKNSLLRQIRAKTRGSNGRPNRGRGRRCLGSHQSDLSSLRSCAIKSYAR